MLRTSWSIFRCLLFFDVCYLLSGIALMILAITDAETVAGSAADKFTMIISGAGFGIFATVSALCNRCPFRLNLSSNRGFLIRSNLYSIR